MREGAAHEVGDRVADRAVRRVGRLGRVALTTLLGLFAVLQASGEAPRTVPVPEIVLEARVVALGIPGAAGVRQVGDFHPGGAIPGDRAFAGLAAPDGILAPDRVLVTSTSNFGAPLGALSAAPGALLSIDPRREGPLLIPPAFAEAGGQVAALENAVQLFSAQSPTFLNRVHNPRAATAALPGVSNPRYISINNAFGRPWVANAPEGALGAGSNTVLDPTGRPLDDPPSRSAGGVFAGSATNRSDQFQAGDLMRAALGTAFLGPSPDDGGLAVFGVAKSDGSLVQVHVGAGVDGLAPAGTLTPVGSDYYADGAFAVSDAGMVGSAFNWTPERILYLTDGPENALLAAHLDDDGRVFVVSRLRRLPSEYLDAPSDLAPAIPEVANPRFSSLTTLAGGADLYVVNRGDGSLLRMRQSGEVVARARLRLPGLAEVGENRLRGIAVSSDAQRLWLTLDGGLDAYPGYDGMLIEVSAFDGRGAFGVDRATRPPARPQDEALVAAGRTLFVTDLSPEDGLGPLFNARSCLACHSEPTPGGAGADEASDVVRVGRLDPNTGLFDPLLAHGGPVARAHGVGEFGLESSLRPGVPRAANITSVRIPPSLYGAALIAEVPDEAILAQAVDKGDGVRGRAHMVTTGSGEPGVGRYGWKADQARLDDMIAAALASELGISSPLAPRPPSDAVAGYEYDLASIRALAAFLGSLDFPRERD